MADPPMPSPDPSDAADSEPSAAAKVFAIPELVEHILVCLAESNIIKDDEDEDDSFFSPPPEPQHPTTQTTNNSFERPLPTQLFEHIHSVSIHEFNKLKYNPWIIHFFQPLISLAAIQRTCTIFNDTVRTSHKIQKLLNRPIERGPWSKHKDILVSMKWLVRTMMGLRGSIGCDEMYYIAFRNLDTTVQGRKEKFLKFQKDNETASWRSVRILRVEYSEIGPNDDPLMVTVNCEVIYRCEKRRRIWDNLEVYHDHKDFEGDVTLGQLSDHICEILTRSEDDHQKHKDEDEKRHTRPRAGVAVHNLQHWVARMMRTTDSDPRLQCLLLVIWILVALMSLIAMHLINQILPDPQSFRLQI